MRSRTGTRGFPRGTRSVLATGLVAAATCGALLALTMLLEPGRWLRAAILAVLVAAAVAAAVRQIARPWWVPTLVASLLSTFGVLVVYGAPPGQVQVVPDTAMVERIGANVRAATEAISSSVVPMTPLRPVEMLVVAGALAAFLLADLLAVGLGFPAWSGLVLVLLWLPAVGLAVPAPVSALVWSGLAYLLLLALNVTPHAVHGLTLRSTASTVALAAGAIAVTLVVGPLLAAAPGWATLSLPSFGTGPVGPLRLSDDLDLRQSLGQRSGQVVMRYTVTDVEDPAGSSVSDAATPTLQPAADARLVGPLRAFTLGSFNGRTWQRVGGDELRTWQPDELLTSDPTTVGTDLDPSAATLARVDITIDELREDRLPVSTFPRTVEIDGRWLYDGERDEVIGDRPTTAGDTYAMTVQVPDLTADMLRGSPTDLPAWTQDYLDVPETDHSQEVADLAAEITAGSLNAYERALSLQSYFRNTTRFQYDTLVAPARTDDAVWDFLESRRGYCVQFATAMTLMARSLGIPARLAVGFLPGVADSNRIYEVTGRQAHAWPELYFPDAGWVRFEPTPAVQSGAPPRWSDPFLFSTAAPDQGEVPLGPIAPLDPGATSTSAAEAAPVEAPDQFPGLLVGAGLTLVVVLSLAGVTLAHRRSRRAAPLDPERAWTRLRERLSPAGITWSDSRTPAQAVEIVRDGVARRGEPLGAEATDALAQLAEAVQRYRYAPNPRAYAADELESWLGAVLTDVAAVSDPRAGASPSGPRSGS